MILKEWSIDELVVAAITLEHDLRGSWGGNYVGRIEHLIYLCELICDRENKIKPKARAKKEFVAKLRGTPDLMAAALNDISVGNAELNNEWGKDGRVFRDNGAFYDMTLPGVGKTERVRQFLNEVMEYPEHYWVAGK